MKVLRGNSGNSILLALVKAFTTVSGILSTMIMSHALSLELYGTFSQTNLIVTTATNLTALGLVDAVNYFYNRSSDEKVQKALTVAGIICVCAKKLLEQIATNSAIILFILGGTYVVGILILNKHKITSTMNQLNKLH